MAHAYAIECKTGVGPRSDRSHYFHEDLEHDKLLENYVEPTLAVLKENVSIAGAFRRDNYGSIVSTRKGTFRSKARTLLSAGDGLQANLTFENINVISVPKKRDDDGLAKSVQLLNNGKSIRSCAEGHQTSFLETLIYLLTVKPFFF